MDPDTETKSKVPKVAKVKNKMPAPVQITAEQLLREAKERELELVQPPPKQKISDEAELKEYRLRKRKAFEDNIRKNRSLMTNWLKYAQWEESQKEIQRARSVYERTLDVDHRNITVWLKYAEMEMRNRQINHARNAWDRAVTILPRANQFWYKYTYMEEMLGNVAGCRQVFERWMEWEPEEQAWHAYINMELRYKELDRARAIYQRFVMVHPEIKNWIKYAKFEEKHHYINNARRIFERAVEYYGEDNVEEKLLIAFAKFEEGQHEHERVRVIYKYALDHLPKDRCQDIYKQYTIHEKKFGDRAGIEDVIVSKRKFQYEEEVKGNPHNYDAWFDYLRLMENDGDPDQTREVYERAIANVPPSQEKRHWRRYIYLWINYAFYEELETGDMERARQVYQACLELIPHKKFTFAKVWLFFAQFEIRQKNLTTARKIMGTAIGKCPKDKLFRGYIDVEIQLREFERCRILYEKFLSFNSENCTTWMKFAELETILGDPDRSRAIFELAINQTRLDMPEVLWKAYIDFEIEQEEFDNVRSLYQRLLQRTQHLKVWISYAQFELSTGLTDAIANCREVYCQGSNSLKRTDNKEETVMLIEAWREFENEYGDEESQASVQKKMPDKVKRRRKVIAEDGSEAGWEEYYDYIFPDDQGAQPNLKLLAMAKKWKTAVDDDDDDDEDNSEESESEDEDKDDDTAAAGDEGESSKKGGTSSEGGEPAASTTDADEQPSTSKSTDDAPSTSNEAPEAAPNYADLDKDDDRVNDTESESESSSSESEAEESRL
uniref:Crooked neck-like protein 1 n=1 Tax=Platynereis dumerilii TaxID=6359 RepID=Q2WBY9_PLADU|nr:crooked neck protein [Platynereis dumerilii]